MTHNYFADTARAVPDVESAPLQRQEWFEIPEWESAYDIDRIEVCCPPSSVTDIFGDRTMVTLSNIRSTSTRFPPARMRRVLTDRGMTFVVASYPFHLSVARKHREKLRAAIGVHCGIYFSGFSDDVDGSAKVGTTAGATSFRSSVRGPAVVPLPALVRALDDALEGATDQNVCVVECGKRRRLSNVNVEEIIKHRGIIDLALTVYPPKANAIYLVGRSADSKPNDRFRTGLCCTIYRLYGQKARVGSLTVQPNRARRASKGATYFDTWRKSQGNGNVFASGVVQKLKMYSNTWHSLQHVVPEKPISFGVSEAAKAETMTYRVMQHKWNGIRNALSIFRGMKVDYASRQPSMPSSCRTSTLLKHPARAPSNSSIVSYPRQCATLSETWSLTLYTLDSGDIPTAFLKFYRKAWSIGLLSGRAGSAEKLGRALIAHLAVAYNMIGLHSPCVSGWLQYYCKLQIIYKKRFENSRGG